MAKTSEKVTDAAANVKPYLERALYDAELRDSVRSAYESARAIYDELLGNRGVTGIAARVASDKDMQDELRSAVSDLRRAADRMQGKEDQSGRNSALLLIGIVLGILFNPFTGPQTRKWIADRVLGGGDDFTYQAGARRTAARIGGVVLVAVVRWAVRDGRGAPSASARRAAIAPSRRRGAAARRFSLAPRTGGFAAGGCRRGSSGRRHLLRHA